MIKYTALLFCLFILFKPAYSQGQRVISDNGPDTLTLFRSGEKGYESYRIPSIITSAKGTLLAFCEGRKKPGDSGDIDLLYKRSTDNGSTWSEQKIIWDDGVNTCGNPTVVEDSETGFIWLVMTHNLTEPGKERSSRNVWTCKTEDDGLTWSVPVDITATTKDSSWRWYATGPGIGIQIKYGPFKGRLVIPCDHSYYDPQGTVKKDGPYEYGDHIIYSDDHGQSWQLGGNILPKVNECQVVELADGNGTLLMNMRSYFGRKCRTQSISYDGGMSWTPPKDVPLLVEPVCQASILRYPPTGKKNQNILLYLGPATTSKRHNMAIRVSYDEGETWPVIKTLFAGPSAYSCLTVLKDGTIGCFYEAGEKGPYERIVFEKLKAKTILGH